MDARTTGRTVARRPGRPARLSREQVLAAALDLADAEGLDALTMRRIGERLGVEAMSLYRHVANKDDVLDGIVDLVFAEMDLPGDGAGWKAFLRGRSISTRHALRRHPWAAPLMETRIRPGPVNLGHHDTVLGVLLAAGFSSADATHAYNLLDSFILGFAIQETGLPFSNASELAEVGEALIRQLAAERFPNLARVGRELLDSGFDYGAEFEFGLDLILDGLERRFAPGGERP